MELVVWHLLTPRLSFCGLSVLYFNFLGLGVEMNKLLFASAVLTIASGVAVAAHADTITGTYTQGLGCTAGCGMITVTDNTTGGVTVDINLGSNFFVKTGNGTNHDSIAMDLTVVPTGISITDPTTTDVTWVEGDDANPAGFSGTYNYYVTISDCHGSSCPIVNELTFTLDGVTTGDFILTDAFPFVSDMNVAGATGNVGATGTLTTTTNPTPEPSSLALLGTGILGCAGVLRRKFLRS